MDIVVQYKKRVVARVTLSTEAEANVNIGRYPDNDIVLERRQASRHHAWIEQREGNFVLIDNHSLNGTTVNGKKIDAQVIKEGDEITFADYTASIVETPAVSSGTHSGSDAVAASSKS